MKGYRYISPMLGEISEELYDAIDFSLEGFLDEYRRLTKKRDKINPAMLRAEKMLFGIRNGRKLYDELVKYGFSSDGVSLEAVKRFAGNDIITDELVARERIESDVLHNLTYRGRLSEAGYESISILKSYALETEINVRPIFIPVYRSQATFTNSETGKPHGRRMRVEMRIFKQSSREIPEMETIDAWNEANDNAMGLPDSNLAGLLDSLEPNPGFEHNHLIDPAEIEGVIDKWYGVLIFTVIGGGNYEYPVL